MRMPKPKHCLKVLGWNRTHQSFSWTTLSFDLHLNLLEIHQPICLLPSSKWAWGLYIRKIMRNASYILSIAAFGSAVVLYGALVYGHTIMKRLPSTSTFGTPSTINLNWYPPSASWITNLSSVVNGSGTYGMLFTESKIPEHGQYSFCFMEHVRAKDYITPSDTFEL